MTPTFGTLLLASPALPVGGFSYSRGLETAVERGWVTDAAAARGWIEGLLEASVMRLDGPLLLRLHRAFAAGDLGEVERWRAFTAATRETRELAAESEAVGGALVRWMEALELGDAAARRAAQRCQLAAFALAAGALGLDAGAALRAFAWSRLEAATAAAVKLVPLGQSDGQRILLAAGRRLEPLCARAETVDDASVGALTPGLALASAWHETQYSRLFRS